MKTIIVKSVTKKYLRPWNYSNILPNITAKNKLIFIKESVEDAVEKREEPLFYKQKDKVNEGKKEKIPFCCLESKLNDILWKTN